MAKRSTSLVLALPSSGTMMWNPFEPEVLTHDGRPSLLEQIAKAERRAAHRIGIVTRRIEIEHADVRVIEIRHARGPHVLRDRVLIGHPQQRTLVGNDRMMDDAVLLGHLDALEPLGKSLRDVLLPEALLADAGRDSVPS